MAKEGSGLSSEDLIGGKRIRRVGMAYGLPVTTSRRMLFNLPPVSATYTTPNSFGPHCEPTFSARSERLSDSIHPSPTLDKTLNKRKRNIVAVDNGPRNSIFQPTCGPFENGQVSFDPTNANASSVYGSGLQQLGFNAICPLNNANDSQSKCSYKASRGKRRSKGRPSSSRSALQKDIEMFRRLTEIPIEAWELPHNNPCQYCRAIRFAYERPGFCCASGKIKIQLPKMPEELWNLYVADMTPLGVEFRRRCRTYNNSLAFTSIKMTYNEALATTNKGVYTFKVQGIIRHYIHELTPKDGMPRHLQLYFYGTERELENRVSQSEGLDSAIILMLVDILRINPYHNFFSNLQNRLDIDTYAIVLRANPKLDQRVYNLPVVDHVAAIWNEGIGPSLEQPRDIKVNLKSGGVRYVHYYYGCYDPLQYCLIFPYGEPGWYAGIPKKMMAQLKNILKILKMI